MGNPSPAGTGYASYYLDDNNHDGKPDINPIFNCAFTYIGDPAWFEVLDNMTMDGEDQVPGLKEILSDDYGRSLGCDGVFLDTIDTAAPNRYTNETSYNMTRFEWTGTGAFASPAAAAARSAAASSRRRRPNFFFIISPER